PDPRQLLSAPRPVDADARDPAAGARLRHRRLHRLGRACGVLRTRRRLQPLRRPHRGHGLVGDARRGAAGRSGGFERACVAEEEDMMFLYDSTLRVPFLLSWPGVLPAGARVNGQLRSVDVLPTLLDLLGLPASPATGVSRAASFKAGSRIPDSASYAESLYGSIHFGYAPLRALRAEG